MGTESSAEKILQDQKKRAGENEKALLTMMQMVDHAERILADGLPLTDFGDLLHESWQLKRSLADGVSNPQIDQAYDAARAAGARGGKLLGAGGRGFICLYATPEKQAAVRSALKGLNEVSFGFSTEGSRIIFKSDE
jgi:D-glycero-alpha-D-manno-heptose-7-phosphate kinase